MHLICRYVTENQGRYTELFKPVILNQNHPPPKIQFIQVPTTVLMWMNNIKNVRYLHWIIKDSHKSHRRMRLTEELTAIEILKFVTHNLMHCRALSTDEMFPSSRLSELYSLNQFHVYSWSWYQNWNLTIDIICDNVCTYDTKICPSKEWSD